jgi:RNA polymerase sigma-70 factor, ECF subfamily
MAAGEVHKADRDPDAYVRLFLAHEQQLFSLIVALVPRLPDAEDIRQEVLRILWEKFGEYRPGTNFLAWAGTIARFKVMEHRRRQRSQRLLFSEELLAQIADDAVHMSDLLQAQSNALAECVSALPEADRELVNYRYQKSVTLADTCVWISKSHVTVRQMLRRIHRLLAKCIAGKLTREGW